MDMLRSALLNVKLNIGINDEIGKIVNVITNLKEEEKKKKPRIANVLIID